MVTKNRNQLITQNDSFGKNCGAKSLGILLRILQNVIEKSFINWRVLSLVSLVCCLSKSNVNCNKIYNKIYSKF
jgi:hypothetical protein